MAESATKELQTLDLTHEEKEHHYDHGEVEDTEDEELEEQIHLWNVIQTFEQYAPYAVSTLVFSFNK